MYSFKDYLDITPYKFELLGDEDVFFSEFCSIQNQEKYGLCFMDGKRVKKLSFVTEGVCNIFLLPISMKQLFKENDSVCMVFSESPKDFFCDAYNFYSSKEFTPKISKSAIIHNEVTMSENVIIGENVVIHSGCKIGEFTSIGDNSVLYSNSIIGSNCLIESNVSIGCPGFGYYKDNNGNLKNFPHIARVVLDDNITIGSNTTIARGGLTDTKIGKWSKVDNQVHIAHNVDIGQNVMIAAGATICGSVTISDDSWIGPNSLISDGIFVGQSSYISLGSTVVKDVKQGEKVTGYFAVPHRKFLRSLCKQ
ncbi:UDP-3-O-(3-hydroxymyristoyl)glucosamine N-acyltransferase [Vibrio scophthalmi]|uniref:UDP-3-O-(3-hydroxymyristoyl)glucosamine N-acyltransferase n=2 Tax=Vibrio scophthalmi TaxID=45658 RepID=A0A1E3WJN8_9VIBR|nr:UDP-3-O-(3-hydroxymyristoyl)glucosamine N-acyltransferase [Vibrio scophthalmi]